MSIYGCHNKPRPVIGMPLNVQAGHFIDCVPQQDGSYDRFERIVQIPFVMSEACQYTKTHATDKLCAGCIHQSKE